MTTVGLDIGTYSIKVVEAKKAGAGFQVLKAVSVPNAVGRVIPADAQERQKLIDLIKSIFKEYHLPNQNVRVGLPEAILSTKIVAMPPLTDTELASAIVWQAEQYIPIPAQDLQLEYQVLYRPPKQNVSDQMRVLLIGASKQLVTQFSSLLYDAELELAGLETNTLALYRVTGGETAQQTTMVVNMGATTMDMFAVHNNELAFVYTYPNGGAVLAQALERGLGLDATQAEAYKRTYGLDDQQLEGKVRDALLPVFRIFTNELQKAFQYFSGAHQGALVKRLILTGGASALPNLIPAIAESLQTEITLFSPFSGSVTLEKSVTVSPLDALSYTAAVGLAMGGA